MLGELTPDRIRHRLHLETVGRIGCHAAGRTYVVPIAYWYDGEAIYAHSSEGTKLRMMRDNPDICFEVEHFEDLANWESVIIQGRFEELAGQEAAAARSRLTNHFRSLGAPWLRTPPRSSDPGHQRVHQFTSSPDQSPIVYRIVPNEMSGRFERAAR